MLATLRLKLSNLARSNEKLMRLVPSTNSQMYLLKELNFPFQPQTFLTNHLADLDRRMLELDVWGREEAVWGKIDKLVAHL